MADLGTAYGSAMNPSDTRTDLLLYPPNDGPSTRSQWKDFSGYPGGGDLGHYPARYAEGGRSQGYGNAMNKSYMDQDMNQNMNQMRAHQDLEGSERQVTNARRRFYTEDAASARRSVASAGGGNGKMTNTLLLVALGLLALLLIDAFLKVRRKEVGPEHKHGVSYFSKGGNLWPVGELK